MLTLFGVYFYWAFPCWFVCPVLFLPWYCSVCDVSDFFSFFGSTYPKISFSEWWVCCWPIILLLEFFGCYIWILCDVTLPNLVICYILFYVARCVVWKWFLFLFFGSTYPVTWYYLLHLFMLLWICFSIIFICFWFVFLV